MFITKKKNYIPIAVIALLVLLTYNGAFGETVVKEEPVYDNSNCWGMQAIDNAGACITPSRPWLGWVVIGVIVLIIVWWLLR